MRRSRMKSVVVIVASVLSLSASAHAQSVRRPVHPQRTSFVGDSVATYQAQSNKLVADDSSGHWTVPPGLVGAAIGAVLGGAVSGLMSSGACEGSNCGDAIARDTRSGILVGAGVGA